MPDFVDKFKTIAKQFNNTAKTDDEKIQELKNTFQIQEEKLNELVKDRATLTNMLELQKSTLTNLLAEKTQEVEELEQKINKMKVARRNAHGSFGSHELNFAPMSIEGEIDGLIPKIKEMSRENQVGFSFEIDDMDNPVVKTDAIYVNAMILKMFDDAFKCAEKRSKIIYYIRQKTPARDGLAEYEYSCIYLGDTLRFDSELVDALGGRITIDRSHGGNVMTVRLKFEVADMREMVAYGLE